MELGEGPAVPDIDTSDGSCVSVVAHKLLDLRQSPTSKLLNSLLNGRHGAAPRASGQEHWSGRVERRMGPTAFADF